jgi:uncharacterized protein involved in exopolysaccharide biosynthesis
MATPSDLYASMLKSDTILKSVVDSLDLMALWKTASSWEAVGRLRDRLTVRVETDGMITLEAIARDADLAAQIANCVASELNVLNLTLESRKSSYQVDFLTGRLHETETELQRALAELRAFQEKHMAISLDLQSAALIENLAQQKARLTAAEIEIGLLERSLHPDHPDLINQRILANEIRHKLDEIERGAGTRSDSVLSAVDIPLDQIPELSLRFSVLKRNVRIQELIYELLAQQLEISRIQERRDTPVVNVLDFARPAAQPFRPRRVATVVAAFLISLAMSVLLAVLYERLRESPEIYNLVSTQMKTTLGEIRRRPLG